MVRRHVKPLRRSLHPQRNDSKDLSGSQATISELRPSPRPRTVAASQLIPVTLLDEEDEDDCIITQISLGDAHIPPKQTLVYLPSGTFPKRKERQGRVENRSSNGNDEVSSIPQDQAQKCREDYVNENITQAEQISQRGKPKNEQPLLSDVDKKERGAVIRARINGRTFEGEIVWREKQKNTNTTINCEKDEQSIPLLLTCDQDLSTADDTTSNLDSDVSSTSPLLISDHATALANITDQILGMADHLKTNHNRDISSTSPNLISDHATALANITDQILGMADHLKTNHNRDISSTSPLLISDHATALANITDQNLGMADHLETNHNRDISSTAPYLIVDQVHMNNHNLGMAEHLATNQNDSYSPRLYLTSAPIKNIAAKTKIRSVSENIDASPSPRKIIKMEDEWKSTSEKSCFGDGSVNHCPEEIPVTNFSNVSVIKSEAEIDISIPDVTFSKNTRTPTCTENQISSQNMFPNKNSFFSDSSSSMIKSETGNVPLEMSESGVSEHPLEVKSERTGIIFTGFPNKAESIMGNVASESSVSNKTGSVMGNVAPEMSESNFSQNSLGLKTERTGIILTGIPIKTESVTGHVAPEMSECNVSEHPRVKTERPANTITKFPNKTREVKRKREKNLYGAFVSLECLDLSKISRMGIKVNTLYGGREDASTCVLAKRKPHSSNSNISGKTDLKHMEAGAFYNQSQVSTLSNDHDSQNYSLQNLHMQRYQLSSERGDRTNGNDDDDDVEDDISNHCDNVSATRGVILESNQTIGDCVAFDNTEHVEESVSSSTDLRPNSPVLGSVEAKDKTLPNQVHEADCANVQKGKHPSMKRIGTPVCIRYVCKHCKHWSSDMDHILKHMRSHVHNERCLICNMVLLNRPQAMDHMQKLHINVQVPPTMQEKEKKKEEEKEKPCKVVRKRYLERDMTKISSSSTLGEVPSEDYCSFKQFSCRICDIICKQVSEMEEHMACHLENVGILYKCLSCEMLFLSSEKCIDHCMSEHVNVRKMVPSKLLPGTIKDNADMLFPHTPVQQISYLYQCQVCMRKFVTKKQILTHMLDHMYGPGTTLKNTCLICKKTFSCDAKLHMDLHFCTIYLRQTLVFSMVSETRYRKESQSSSTLSMHPRRTSEREAPCSFT